MTEELDILEKAIHAGVALILFLMMTLIACGVNSWVLYHDSDWYWRHEMLLMSLIIVPGAIGAILGVVCLAMPIVHSILRKVNP